MTFIVQKCLRKKKIFFIWTNIVHIVYCTYELYISRLNKVNVLKSSGRVVDIQMGHSNYDILISKNRAPMYNYTSND